MCYTGDNITSVQVNIRTTEFLASELDRIVQDGYFKSRSEALNEGIRLLIRKYQLAKLEAKFNSIRENTEDLDSLSDALIRARQEEDS